MRTGTEEKTHIKVVNCYYSKVFKLANFTKWHLKSNYKEKFKIITSSFCKWKLQQDQENINKTNKCQIKPNENKPNLKANQPVKTMKQKSLCQKMKSMLKNKNGLVLFVKILWKIVKWIGLLIECTQCACMAVIYLLFLYLVWDYSHKKQTSLTLQHCYLIFLGKSFSESLLILALLKNYALFHVNKRIFFLLPNSHISSVLVIFSDDFSFFFLFFEYFACNFHFAPVMRKWDTATHDDIIPLLWKQSRLFLWIFVVYVEGTKV